MSSNILVSIIIPHKNIPNLLERCVKSIPDREDIEVIVVDDNSDVFPICLEKYCGQNNRVKIINTGEGKGAGYARNIGLDESNGKWIIFADADDYFYQSALSAILDKYADCTSELIVFDTDSVMSDTLEKVDNRELLVKKYKLSKDKNILRYEHHAVWGKMFQRKLALKHGIRFQEVVASNDAYFAASYGVLATQVIFEPSVAYCCTVRNGSICTRITEESTASRLYVSRAVNRLYHENNVQPKYWMNQLGPLFNMLSVNKRRFIKEMVVYLLYTNILRIFYDICDSGGRFVKRLEGNINDKEIKSFQIKEKN